MFRFLLPVSRSIFPIAVASFLALGPIGLSTAGEHPALAVLERNCLSCHNAHDAKGDVAFESAPLESEDLALILESVSGPAPEMPKDGDPLAPDEIRLLEDWIERGAPIPEDRVLRDTFVPGRDWWSLKPLSPGQVPNPALFDDPWVMNEIDAFVLAKLHEKSLSPSPEATPRNLIRRLTYNLTGLPPEPDAIAAFEVDYARDPEATWTDAVDRLLASPAYGEHWARHWLDVARYGETHGYDKDKPRPNAWPYRDYVIRSFNQDKPWSRFVQEQIAGDTLFPGDPDGVVALGFIAAGPWDFIAHFEVGEGKLDGRIAKHMDRDDMVSATFNAFLSTTVQCAQCHHHKFDPVSMEDYYRLHAVFAAVDRAPRLYDIDPAVQKKGERLDAEIRLLTERREALEKALLQKAGPEYPHLLEDIRATRKAVEQSFHRPREYGFHSAIEKKSDRETWVQIELPFPLVINEIVLHPANDDYAGIGAGFGFPLRYRVEVADNIAFTENVRVLVDATGEEQLNPRSHPVHLSGKNEIARFVRLTATQLAERKNDYILALAEMEVRDVEGSNQALNASVTSSTSTDSRPRWHRTNVVDGRFPRYTDQEAAQQLAKLESREREIRNRSATPARQKELSEIAQRQQRLIKERKQLPKGQFVYAAATQFEKFGKVLPTKGQARPIHLLYRGDLRSPGPEMLPGAPPLWEGATAEFALPREAAESERRAALAGYLTAPENPLAWRSIANRTWLHHFGRGIVDSPNDFGRMGMTPTHPELLDFLAAKLRDDPRQSLKSLHRLIVTSATWRQAVTENPQHEAIDSGNAYYWRGNRRRLSAEEIRDSVLSVAGKLNRTMGGPSFQDFVIEKPQHSPHYQYHLHDHNDPASHRRSIYRMIARSKTQPFLTTLDCADPSQMVARRDETTTALQALALMNNPFMETMAGHFAARIKGEPDPVSTAFLLATGRPATLEERSLFADYAAENGLENACRVILNLSEFAYVD